MSLPSTPSPAAHTSPRRTITEGTGGHLVRFWAMLSPHLASNQNGSASTVCHPPRIVLVLVSLPLFQVVRVRAESQPGRAIPSRSFCRPSPPCRGVPGHMAVKFCLSSENQGHCRAAGALFQAKGKHSNTFSQLIKSLTEKRGLGIKYSKIATKNKNNNYSVRNINFSPNFNRKIQSFS